MPPNIHKIKVFTWDEPQFAYPPLLLLFNKIK
jgi:hypothetical protein